MDIITKTAPEIDPARLEETLEEFRSYMMEMLTLIDFTLSTQKTKISGAVSEENFDTLKADLAALSSTVASVSSAVYSISESVATVEGNVSQMQTTLEDHESRITALESA